ncbi:MAG TPA: Imm74 family immunity protein [Thermoanaerobaculia bacterium]|jgi:hypothetical protein
MFAKPSPNVIESDAFSVEVLGRTGLRYTDHQTSRTARIDSELLAGPAAIVVYTDSIRQWEALPDRITDTERITIVERIKDAFKFSGYEIELV